MPVGRQVEVKDAVEYSSLESRREVYAGNISRWLPAHRWVFTTWSEYGEKGEAAENSALASSVARGWGGASDTGKAVIGEGRGKTGVPWKPGEEKVLIMGLGRGVTDSDGRCRGESEEG